MINVCIVFIFIFCFIYFLFILVQSVTDCFYLDLLKEWRAKLQLSPFFISQTLLKERKNRYLQFIEEYYC